MSVSSAQRAAWVFCALAALASAGCPWTSGNHRPIPPLADMMPAADDLSSSERSNSADATTAADEANRRLNSENWVHTIKPVGRTSESAAGYRWRQPDVEQLLAGPASQRPDLRAALAAEPVVAANAAICLARLNDASGASQLAAAVRDSTLKVPLRLAAAESLGRLDGDDAAKLLEQLLDQYGEDDPGRSGPYLAELHAELIRGLARHARAAHDPRIVKALRSESPAVRLAALTLWSEGPGGPMPIEAVDLRVDPDPNVRVAAIEALARQQDPKAVQHLAVAMADGDLQVRLAAIASLGRLGGSEAEQFLVKRLDDDAELIRAAAVSALAEAGLRTHVLAAATDSAWRVRAAVARELFRYPNREGLAVALQLVGDPSATVQADAVEAVGRWPLARCGRVLLAAMQSTGYQTRHTAARHLAGLWPPSETFPMDGPAQRRTQILADLVQRFEAEYPLADSDAAVVDDPSVVPASAVEKIAEPVSWTADQFEDRLVRLGSPDLSVRRNAASELAAGPSLDPAAIERLVALVLQEPDPLVWQRVLTSIARSASEPAVRLAYAALGHPSAEVRRRACEHLAAHPSPDHATVLSASLDDPIDAVRLAAIEALAAAGRLDDAGPLKRVLASSNSELRLAAAAALSKIRDPAGPAALERLTHSDDPTERRLAAEAIGRLDDPSLAAALVRLLDDRPAVRTAAFQSLVEIAGRDVTANPDGPPLDPARQNELWRDWLETR